MDRQKGLEGKYNRGWGNDRATFSSSEIFYQTFFTQLYFSSDEDFLPDPNPIYIYIKPHSISILLGFKMVFLQYKNLINTAWRSWTGNGKHTNRYFISGSQSTENWYHWKGFLIWHWEHLCLPSHSTGVKENTTMLGLPHKRLQLQNLSLF